MARAWIDLKLRRFSRGVQPFLHRFHLIRRDARILGAVKAEHRRLDLGCAAERRQGTNQMRRAFRHKRVVPQRAMRVRLPGAGFLRMSIPDRRVGKHDENARTHNV